MQEKEEENQKQTPIKLQHLCIFSYILQRSSSLLFLIRSSALCSSSFLFSSRLHFNFAASLRSDNDAKERVHYHINLCAS